MNVAEIRARKEKAEDMISDILRNFSEETGCTIDNVSVSRTDCTPISSKVPKIVYEARLTASI